MHRGYIKIWRKIQDSGLLLMPNTLALFMHILLNATHKTIKVGTKTGFVELERGQYISGLIKLSTELKQSIQKIRTSLERLEKAQILTIKSTNKYSIYTIVNYEHYQSTENEVTNKTTLKQQTNNKQITTKQALEELETLKNKEKINKKEKSIKVPLPDNFKVSDKVMSWYIEEKYNIPIEKYLVHFIDSAIANGYKYANWDSAFKNAIRSDWAKLRVNGSTYKTAEEKRHDAAIARNKELRSTDF